MTNITEIEIEMPDGSLAKHIIIDNGDDTFTSMPKAEYDRQQAEHFTPSV
jgi:hypothetical protein